MTELAGVHTKFTGDANGLNAAVQTAKKGVETFQKSAEASAKVFERAFARSEKSVDQLRRAIDPVYAASKRYEAAVETLDAALRQGTISQAAHTRMLDQASTAYLRSQNAAGAMGQRLGFLGSMTDQTRGKIQQVGFQVQDFAVQVGAGTSATQAFAQQFPQLAGAFGPVGVAIGTLAAIGIPLLVAAFGSAAAQADVLSEAAERQKTVIEGLTAATAALRLERDMAATGASTEAEQRGLEELNRLTAERARLMESIENAQKRGYTARAEEARAQLRIVDLNIQTVEAKLRTLKAEEAMTPAIEQKRKGAEAYRELQAEIAGMNISGPWNAVIGAIQQAINKQRELASISQMTAIGGGRGAGPGGPVVGSADLAALQAGGGVIRPMAPVGPNGGGGGGGGAGAGTVEVDSLRQSLMTKEQIELESYTRRQEALQAALDQRMITEDEFRRMSEEQQRQHADKMTQLDVWRYGTGLQKAGAFFGEMSSAMQGGNEKMLAIAKKFGAAQALISAWQGAAEALKLPFPQNLGAFAKVLATGLSAVNAIKGAGAGGGRGAGGASAGGAAASAPSAPPEQRLLIDYRGPDAAFPSFSALVEMMNKAGKAGYVLNAEITGAR